MTSVAAPWSARPVVRRFFERPTLEVARDLIGCLLVHDAPDGLTAGVIVETEAYGEGDPGSHAFRGQTKRNAPMFEQAGIAYVYFTYGMHHCLNAVTERTGVAGAVLIRAVEPIEGLELMRARRRGIRDRDLARGPGRLTKALGVDASHNRTDLTSGRLRICPGERMPEQAIGRTARIGLAPRAQDGRRWRFVLRDSPWVSGPRATGSRRS